MSTVAIAVTYTNQTIPAPAGTVVAAQQLTLTDPAGASTVTSEAVGVASITLTLTVPGAYTAALQAQDQNGKSLGSPASVNFSIAAPTVVTLSLPSALTATVT